MTETDLQLPLLLDATHLALARNHPRLLTAHCWDLVFSHCPIRACPSLALTDRSDITIRGTNSPGRIFRLARLRALMSMPGRRSGSTLEQSHTIPAAQAPSSSLLPPVGPDP